MVCAFDGQLKELNTRPNQPFRDREESLSPLAAVSCTFIMRLLVQFVVRSIARSIEGQRGELKRQQEQRQVMIMMIPWAEIQFDGGGQCF